MTKILKKHVQNVKEEKTLDKFHLAKNKGSIRSCCKKCSSNQRKLYYQLNKAVIKQTTQYQNNKRKTDPKFKLEKKFKI